MTLNEILKDFLEKNGKGYKFARLEKGWGITQNAVRIDLAPEDILIPEECVEEFQRAYKEAYNAPYKGKLFVDLWIRQKRPFSTEEPPRASLEFSIWAEDDSYSVIFDADKDTFPQWGVDCYHHDVNAIFERYFEFE